MDTSRINCTNVKFRLFDVKVSRYIHISGGTLDLGRVESKRRLYVGNW